MPANASLEAFSELRGRLSLATQELHQTLSALMGVIETQIQEVNGLREQLHQSEASLQQTAPQLMPVIQPPVATARSSSMSPLQSPSFGLSRPLSQPVVTQAAAASAKVPSGPMMTQILWPSKHQGAAEPATAPQSAPSPVFLRPSTQMKPQNTAVKTWPHSALETVLAQPQPDATPALEQSTLEELNAALAYAFAQVSSTSRPIDKGSVTHMMPAPIPTSALRYGQIAEPVSSR